MPASQPISIPGLTRTKRNKVQESMTSRIGFVMCSCGIIINLIILALYFSPHHIRHPIQQKMQRLVYPEMGATQKPARPVMRAVDSDSSAIQFSFCDDDNNSTLTGRNETFLSSLSCDAKLERFGFRVASQTCSNFEEMRMRSSGQRGTTDPISSCTVGQSLLFSSSSKQQHQQQRQQHFFRPYTEFASRSALRRTVAKFSTLFNLNGSTTVNFDNIIPGETLANVSETEKIFFGSGGSELHSEKALADLRNKNCSTPERFMWSPTRLVGNLTLRKQHQGALMLLNEAKKVNLHVDSSTKMLSVASTKKPQRNAATLASIFIVVCTSMFHDSLKNRRALVVSSRPSPIIESTILALTNVAHVDSINFYSSDAGEHELAVAAGAVSSKVAPPLSQYGAPGSVYRTQVPTIVCYSPAEFRAAVAEEIAGNRSSGNVKWQNAGKYSVVVSYQVVSHLGLGRELGLAAPLDPFADLRAMNEYWQLLRSGGMLILTLPVGADCLDFNRRRIYGRERLALLLRGWTIDLAVGFGEEVLWKRRACGAVSDALLVLRKVEPHSHDEELSHIEGMHAPSADGGAPAGPAAAAAAANP